jgi:hypothetical protein
MNLHVVVHFEAGGFVLREFFACGGFIFVPVRVLEGSVVEKDMWALRVILLLAGGAEGGPSIPDFLEIGLVNLGRPGGSCLSLLLRWCGWRGGGLRKTGWRKAEERCA